MVKYRIIEILLIVSFISCNENRKVPLEGSWSYNKVDTIPFESYFGKTSREHTALDRIKKYLDDKKLDSFYVVAKIYPDSLTSKEHTKVWGNNFIGIELVHKSTLSYVNLLNEEQNRIDSINNGNLEEELIIPPITGNISGVDRTIFYFFDGDSIMDVISQ